MITELVGQFEQRLVHHGGVLRVNDLAALFLGCGNHFRMAVPGAGDADAGGEVQVVETVRAVDPRPLRVIDDNRRGLFQGRAEGGAAHGYTVTAD